jgi:hypothetical protein
MNVLDRAEQDESDNGDGALPAPLRSLQAELRRLQTLTLTLTRIWPEP